LSYIAVIRGRYARQTVFKTSKTGPLGPVFYTGIAVALIGFGLFFDHAATVVTMPSVATETMLSDLARVRASPEVGHVAQWAVESRDHAGLPFVVVDKARARLFAFDGSGRLLASAPVLLGASRADGPAAPAATPAGRFVAATWLSVHGNRIVWINGEAAVSLHGIPSGVSPGRGPQRLASDDVGDKRISDGSLHVAGQFYRDYLSPLEAQASVVYVLPEVLPVREVFDSHERGTWFSFAQSPRNPQSAKGPS
jgi:hypothetical protein